MTRSRTWSAVCCALALSCASGGSVERAPAASARAAARPEPGPPLTPAAARHVWNRFAFGPRPGDVDRLRAIGLERWLDEQLAPAAAPDPALDAALEPYRSALSPPAELVESWLGPDGAGDAMDGAELNREIAPHFREHLTRLALAELTRHVQSQRQLEEVMVDFWVNHFNVFARKSLVRVFAGDYIERAIRPHALGRFADLLRATAEHPAMLIYLDNQRSFAARPGPGGDGKPGGLNENYARELLELHTLGAGGGYTQADVIDTARILTGFSVTRPRQGSFEFVFRTARHDFGEKHVLGQTFPAGHGRDEGIRLLELLAAEPATAQHLGSKLCAYFVSDDPPDGCVRAASAAYTASGGEISAVLRAIARDPSFWSVRAENSKLKTPLEFVASALRALGAVPDGSRGLAPALERLGEPLLLERVPTGYPDASADWATSSGLLGRMNFATRLAAGRVPGVTLDLERLLPDVALPGLVTRVNQLVCGGAASARTLAAVNESLGSLEGARERRSLAVALLLASPEFQRQ